jgi:hypothetical protein
VNQFRPTLMADELPELVDLVRRLFDNALDPLEVDRLEQLVRGRADGRSFYLRTVNLIAGLHLCLAPEDGMKTFSVSPQHVEAEPTPTRQPATADALPQEKPRVKPLVLRLPALFSRSALGATLLVALLIYGAFTVIAWKLRPDNLPSSHDGNNIAVATIRDTADVKWSPTVAPMADDLSVQQGAPLAIETGIVELELKRGATLRIEGPARWSIIDENHAMLESGKALARVPAQAVGFTLDTPSATVVDLGTEFGVDVDASGRTDVQVLEGAVNVDYSSSAGESKSPRRSVRMTAGSAKRFSAQSTNANRVTATEIAPWLDQSVSLQKSLDEFQNLPAETKFAAAVLADRPLGYWRFSDTDSHRASDASGHGNHGEYVGFVSTNNAGICPNTRDRSVRFLGKDYAGFVQINDFELPASCTVEIWARSTTPTWNTYGWLFSSTAPNGLQISPQDGSRAWHAHIRNNLNAAPPVGTHQGPSNIADRFHQYVISYDAATDRGAMYCDGVLVRETANLFGTSPHREAAQLTFYVGCVDPRTKQQLWGEGSVDELAIYGEALNPGAVKRHYEATGYSTSNKSDP